MSVCLRCDWRGDDAGAVTSCPRCGEPLFRPEPAPARATDDERRRDAPRPEPIVAAADDTRVRWRRLATTVLPFALVLVVIAVGTAATSDEPEAPAGGGPSPSSAESVGESVAPPLPPLTGSVVYSRRSPSAEHVQLWIWDLARGRVDGGAVVRRPQELVGASIAGPGRVGITWRRNDGRLQAALIEPSDPGAVAEPVVVGDLVAWSARGSRATAATIRSGEECPRTVTIDAVRLQPDLRLAEPGSRLRTCGDVLSLASDGAMSYFTYLAGRRVHVAYPGVERPTIVLPDHELLGASWAGDMIVRPIGRRREGALAYYSRTSSDPSGATVPYNADASFAFGGVLAWAPSSFEALVLGVSSGRPSPTPGIYALDTLPADGIDPPRWVMAASGPTSATYTGDGVALVATAGDVFAVHDGGVSPVPLPIGAPLVDGRVAWIP